MACFFLGGGGVGKKSLLKLNVCAYVGGVITLRYLPLMNAFDVLALCFESLFSFSMAEDLN